MRELEPLKNIARTLFDRARTENWAGSDVLERRARAQITQLINELLTTDTEVNLLAVDTVEVESKKATLILILHGLLALLANCPLQQTFNIKFLRELYPDFFVAILLNGNQLVKQCQLLEVPKGSVFVSSATTNPGSNSFEYLLKSLAMHARAAFDALGGLDVANTLYHSALSTPASENNALIKNTLNLAVIYRKANRFEKAITLYQKVKVLQQQKDSNDYKTAYTLSLLGFCHFSLKQYDTAKLYFDDALEQLENNEPDSWRCALTLFYLAEIMLQKNSAEDAKRYYMSVLDIIKKNSTVASSINMPLLYLGLGKAHEMLNTPPIILLGNYRNALTYSTHNKNKIRIEIETRLANTLHSLGQYKNAATHFETALLIATRIAQNPIENIWAQIGYANTLLALGCHKKAKKYYEAALALAGSHNQEEPHAIALAHYAHLYTERGEYITSENLLCHALTLAQKHYGNDSALEATILYYLGDCYIAQGKFQIAKNMLEKSLAIKETYYGKEHPKYAVTLKALAWLSKQEGQYQQALELMQTAHNIFLANQIPQESTEKALSEIRRLIRDQCSQAGARIRLFTAHNSPDCHTDTLTPIHTTHSS